MVAAPGGGRTPTNHRQAGGLQRAQAPAAVELPEAVQLPLQPFTTGIPASIVVAQDTGQRQFQLPQQIGNAAATLTEITHQQQGVGPDRRQQAMVRSIPLVVEVTGDGNLQLGHRPCLPRLLPILTDARNRLNRTPPRPSTATIQAAAAQGITTSDLASPAVAAPDGVESLSPALASTPIQAPSAANLPAAIEALRRERNAVILAHYYQEPEIQDIADVIGDSLELSRRAAATEAEVILFCGVHFMAETAKILNPSRTVLVPDLAAGCSLADGCPADAFAAFRAEHPDHYVVSYINCSAAVKAQSDLICTSSNAVALVRQLPEERPILFAPDANLGRWVARQSGRELTLWPGSCIVHETFSEQALLQLRLEHPEAEVIAHPECQPHLLDLADFIGSTSKLLERVQTSPAPSFIVLTEPGILHQMHLRAPDKTLLAVPGSDGCSCNACPYMRLNTLEKVWHALATLQPAIELDEDLRRRALVPIERMLAMSA